MQQRRRVFLGALVGALAVVLIGWAAWPREAEAAYVTAPASRGSVTQQITLVGPTERESQAVLTFDTPGLVTAVLVEVGDQVVAGQQVATVDAAPLRLAVLQTRAAVAQAEAQLDADLTARANSTDRVALGTGGVPVPSASAGATRGASSGVSGLGAGEPPAYVGELTASLTAVQQAIAAQQQVCTPVFATLQQLRDAGESVPDLPTASPLPPEVTTLPTPAASTPISPTATPDPSASVSPGLTPSAEPTPTAATAPTGEPGAVLPAHPTAWPSGHPTLPTALPSSLPTAFPSGLPTTPPTSIPTGLPTAFPTTPPSGLHLENIAGFLTGFQACSESMAATAQAEGRAGAAILTATQAMAQANQQAAAGLATAQAELQAAAQQAADQAIAAAQQQIADQIAALAGGAVTDATIARDRATLLQARQQLETAETNLTAATLSSPISGTVGALDFVVGESSAGRSATVVGPGSAKLTVEVPLSVRGLVAPGTAVSVGQLAAAHTLAGQVTTVSVLPSGTGGTPHYSATILADDPDGLLPSGAYAEATLSLRTAADVLTVPISAVTKVTDTTATVEVVHAARDTEAETLTVVTGAHGGGRVEIVSGLTEGQLVVLADRRLPVPGGLQQYQSIRASASPTPTR